MEIQQLRYILALSEELHFGRAAKRLHVTQPTLSQQIKKLEEELRAPLFERSAHGVSLTDAGKRLIPHARSILSEIALTLAEIKEKSAEIVGTIRISAIPTIAPYLLPSVILRLKEKAPKLKLEIYEETTSVLVQHLKEGELDLGVLALPIKDSNLVSRSMGKEAFYVAASKHHPLAAKKSVTIANIQKEDLLMLQEGHCFSEQALEFCKRSRDDEQIIFQGSSLTSVMKLAEVSEGITLVPKMAVDIKNNPNLNFIPFSNPSPKRELGILWRVTHPLTKAHRLLMEIIDEVFNQKTS